METTILSSKGQLVIPKSVREQARLSPGTRMRVSYVGGEIHLKPLPPLVPATLDDVAGCLADASRKPLTDAQAKAAIARRLAARHAPR